jgi:hypothetical protein
VPCRLGGGAPAPEETKARDAAELTDRAYQRAGQNKTARKLIELSPRHWRVAEAARLAGTGQSRQQLTRNVTGEQPKRIA